MAGAASVAAVALTEVEPEGHGVESDRGLAGGPWGTVVGLFLKLGSTFCLLGGKKEKEERKGGESSSCPLAASAFSLVFFLLFRSLTRSLASLWIRAFLCLSATLSRCFAKLASESWRTSE